MDSQFQNKIIIYFLLIYAVGISIFVISNEYQSFEVFDVPDPLAGAVFKQAKNKGIKPFYSAEDFKNYLSKADNVSASTATGRGGGAVMMKSEANALAPQGLGSSDASAGPSRVSETNVQVAGIDEPDIVKTDGENIYISNEFYYYPLMMKRGMPGSGSEDFAADSGLVPPMENEGTKIIKALPPEEIKKIGGFKKNGTLLLDEKTLIIFSSNVIYGYDIASSSEAKEKWTIKLKENSSIVTSRKYGNKIYMIVKENVNRYNPCPLEPYEFKGSPVKIECGKIYHPVMPIAADVTYTAVMINPQSGETENSFSFIGSDANSIVYMSPNSIYLSYSAPADFVKFMIDFLKSNQGIMPDVILSKLLKLEGYDLSYTTKQMELMAILEQYRSSLGGDERLKFENDFSNKAGDYLKAHKRELESTGIVKISVKDFKPEADGIIPGTILNQFSMDEFQGNLRVAATIGGNGWWGLGFGSNSQSANDVYVLDKDMKITGSLKDLAPEERIYAVRFIEDKGYVVTFKQIDPFFVIDLSDQKNPLLKGQLKIPGFSSYLHPLAKNIILGVGQEDSRVKLSLFDVSNPENPVEISKYSMDEYWTEVSSNHHAFLNDGKQKVFFIPGGKGGYIFSYDGNELKLVKAVSGIQAKRALYINDYLYIIGTDKITVLNENNWEKAGEMTISN